MTCNPQSPLSIDLTDCPPAIQVLAQLRNGLARSISGQRAEPIFLHLLNADTQALVLEALGDGEIRAELDAHDPYPQVILSETGVTGVWHWRLFDAAGQLVEDALEAGDCPQLMHERPFQTARTRIHWPRAYSDDMMDAVALLAELEAHLDLHPENQSASPASTPGPDINSPDSSVPHRVNLSMLPQNPAAMALIDHHLGRGPARLINQEYGRCEINATAVRPIWRLRHFNNAGQLLLDSVEICPVPTAVLATMEDLTDSHTRISELLAAVGINT
jgi:hydrogenase-1 operon protein HyaF